MDEAVIRRVTDAVRRDLQSGAWDRRFGHLRELDAFGRGLQLIVDKPESHNRVGCLG
jgi:hypothetical protein